MKKIFTLIALFSLLYGESFSQGYSRMLKNPSWIVKMTSSSSDIDYLDIIKIGDTTIGGKNYLVLGDTLKRILAICREDSTERKVYIYEDNQDKILFDFSLQKNDNITLSNGGEYIVQSIDSVSVRGGIRRRIYLTHFMYSSQSWVEGVGNVEYPLQQVNLIQDPIMILQCSFQDSFNIFNYGIYSSGQDTSECKAYSPNISVNKISVKNNYNVYPNPSTNLLTIDFKNRIPNKIEIQDIHGRTVYSQSLNPIQSFLEISLVDISSGVYFVKIFSNEGVVLTKVIKE